MPNAFPRYLCLNTLGAVQLGGVLILWWPSGSLGGVCCLGGADCETVRPKEKIHAEHRIGKQFYLDVSNLSGFSSN